MVLQDTFLLHVEAPRIPHSYIPAHQMVQLIHGYTMVTDGLKFLLHLSKTKEYSMHRNIHVIIMEDIR